MRQYKTIPNDYTYTEKELNNILQSDSFEVTVRALANRNPSYARTMFHDHYPMDVVFELCNIACHLTMMFEAEVISEGWSNSEEYEQAHYSEFHMFKDEFYGQYILNDEPYPMNYREVLNALKKAKIDLSDKQEHALYAQIGSFTEKELEELLSRCREAVEIFGWNHKNGEPMYVFTDEKNMAELVNIRTFIKDNRRYILAYYTEGKDKSERLAKSLLSKVIKRITLLAKQYCPTVTHDEIESFVLNHKDFINGKVDVVKNARLILECIDSIIKHKTPKSREYYCIKFLSEIK